MTRITVSAMPVILPVITCITCKVRHSSIKLEWKDIRHIEQKLAICDECGKDLEADLKAARKEKL